MPQPYYAHVSLSATPTTPAFLAMYAMPLFDETGYAGSPTIPCECRYTYAGGTITTDMPLIKQYIEHTNRTPDNL